MKRISLISIILILVAGCMFKQYPKLYPFPSSEITVVGKTIYCSGKPFAELKFFSPLPPVTPPEQETFSGLVMYYYDNDKEVWIYPEKRLSVLWKGIEYTKIEDMQSAWDAFNKEHRNYWVTKQSQTPPSPLFVYLDGKPWDITDAARQIEEIIISEDGKYVHYKVEWMLSMLWTPSYKYLVEYGISK